MELINGNVHIKKSDKIRDKRQLFTLSIDGEIKIEPTKVLKNLADLAESQGFKIAKIFIEE